MKLSEEIKQDIESIKNNKSRQITQHKYIDEGILIASNTILPKVQQLENKIEQLEKDKTALEFQLRELNKD